MTGFIAAGAVILLVTGGFVVAVDSAPAPRVQLALVDGPLDPPVEAAAVVLPVSGIEGILRAHGTLSGGVLWITIDRSGLLVRRRCSVTAVMASAEFRDQVSFRSGSGGSAVLDAELALRARELEPVIGALRRHGIAFQQAPLAPGAPAAAIRFLHVRQQGDPLTLARNLRAVLGETAPPG